MKILKKTLGDGKNYTLRTFSVTEQKAIRTLYREFESRSEEADKIRFILDEDGNFKKENGKLVLKDSLSEDEKKKIYILEDANIDFMLDVIRKSLCLYHPEFKKNDDPTEDAKILEKIGDILDSSEMKRITFFLFNGQYDEEEDVIDCLIEKPNGKSK